MRPVCAALATLFCGVCAFTFPSRSSAGPLDDWTSQQLSTTNILTGVTYGNGTYVTVGYSGELWTSPDASAWTKRSFAASMRFLGVAYGSGVFVAGGSQPFPGGTNGAGTIQTSTDGITWTATAQSGYCNNYNGTAFTNEKFIVVADAMNVGTSSDGYSWTGPNLNGGGFTLYGSTFGNGTYVVALSGGLVWASATLPRTGLPSPIGVNNLHNTGTSSDLLGIAYGNSIFVAVGSGGTITTSPDGVSWTPRSSGTSNTLYSVAFGNGSFVAVGSGGTLLVSTDGVTWASKTSNTTNQLRGISFVENRFIAVGVNGTVVKSSVNAASTGTVANISTRSLVQGGDNVMIAGVIIQNGSRKIIVRAVGPSLAGFGVANALADPSLELREGDTLLATNNDWQTTQTGGLITGDQVAQIQNSGLAPTNEKEAALIVTLPPGTYTAIVRGIGGATGVGSVEVYALP